MQLIGRRAQRPRPMPPQGPLSPATISLRSFGILPLCCSHVLPALGRGPRLVRRRSPCPCGAGIEQVRPAPGLLSRSLLNCSRDGRSVSITGAILSASVKSRKESRSMRTLAALLLLVPAIPCAAGQALIADLPDEPGEQLLASQQDSGPHRRRRRRIHHRMVMMASRQHHRQRCRHSPESTLNRHQSRREPAGSFVCCPSRC